MGESRRSPAYLIKPYSSDLVSVDGSPAPAAVLYAALKDADAEVRVCAALGLARAGDLSAPVVDLLFGAANWRRTPEALADHPKVTERLHMLLAGAQRASERGTIAITLAGLGEVADAVTAAFLEELSSTDTSVRERIVRNWWLLGDGDPQLLAHLYAALDDPEEMVRTSAAASLNRLGR